MAKVIVNDEYLMEIAAAIRTKTGHVGSIMPSQFARVLAMYYKVAY